MQEIVQKPTALFQLMGQKFPFVGGYFITVVVSMATFGTAWELARPLALLGAKLKQSVFGTGSQRARRLTAQQRRRLSAPPQMPFERVYPSLLLVITICFVYAVITPAVVPFCAVYFAAAELVYKRNLLYVYVPTSESGGTLWPKVVWGMLVALITSHCVLIGYFYFTAGALLCASLVVPLPCAALAFGLWAERAFFEPAQYLPLRDALERVARDEAAAAAFDGNLYRQPALLSHPARGRRVARETQRCTPSKERDSN